jgi:hypothetical protein
MFSARAQFAKGRRPLRRIIALASAVPLFAAMEERLLLARDLESLHPLSALAT